MARRESKYASRKFWFGVGTSVLIFLCGICVAEIPGFRSGLETLIGGLLGAYAIYSGSNVGAQYLGAKVAKAVEEEEEPKPEPPKPAPVATKDQKK